MQPTPPLAQPLPVDHAAAVEHAWRYFELHSTQRLTVFNFFVVFSSLIAAGLGSVVSGEVTASGFGIPLGLLLCLLALVFWKLDQRNSSLIKRAEQVLSLAEGRSMEPAYRLFERESDAATAANATGGRFLGQWTFGQSFRLMFLVMAFAGAGGVALSTLRLARVINWGQQSEQAAPSRVTVTVGTPERATEVVRPDARPATSRRTAADAKR
ncbi:MAG: hypothetical protein K2Y05_05525 [Hyphomicrobiaceae bacterium]|nr:hypothetical protein [Hyphomicrobiaceae bacterium]